MHLQSRRMDTTATATATCIKCERTAAKDTMWELRGGGTALGWECCAAKECLAEQLRLKHAKAAAPPLDLGLQPSTDDEFFAKYGIRVDELSPGPQYRDGHRRFVHLPTGRTFKYNTFVTSRRWVEQ